MERRISTRILFLSPVRSHADDKAEQMTRKDTETPVESVRQAGRAERKTLVFFLKKKLTSHSQIQERLTAERQRGKT